MSLGRPVSATSTGIRPPDSARQSIQRIRHCWTWKCRRRVVLPMITCPFMSGVIALVSRNIHALPIGVVALQTHRVEKVCRIILHISIPMHALGIVLVGASVIRVSRHEPADTRIVVAEPCVVEPGLRVAFVARKVQWANIGLRSLRRESCNREHRWSRCLRKRGCGRSR